MMNHDTIVLVQRSFKAVAPIADDVGPMFYARLFEVHPELRPLFPEDMQVQARKLVQMLAMVVNSLHRLDAILPAVEELARRHSGYGVAADHYSQVGEVLIWTLEQGLGDTMTPSVRHAWIIAYATLARAMIAAAGRPADTHCCAANHGPDSAR
jgi:hemoglobin-like flavoprotein